MLGLPCFAGAFCADQDDTDGATSDLEMDVGWSSVEESEYSDMAVAVSPPSRQLQLRVSHVAFGCRR